MFVTNSDHTLFTTCTYIFQHPQIERDVTKTIDYKYHRLPTGDVYTLRSNG